MFDPKKLTEYEKDCLARRLRGEFVARKLAIHGDRLLRHRYEQPAYLETFRAAVAAHHPRDFRRIIDGDFKAIDDPQPEDLCGEEAVRRTESASSPTEDWTDDAVGVEVRLERESEWLRSSLSHDEYRGQALLRYPAAILLRDAGVPDSGLYSMPLEKLRGQFSAARAFWIAAQSRCGVEIESASCDNGAADVRRSDDNPCLCQIRRALVREQQRQDQPIAVSICVCGAFEPRRALAAGQRQTCQDAKPASGSCTKP